MCEKIVLEILYNIYIYIIPFYNIYMKWIWNSYSNIYVLDIAIIKKKITT